MLSNFDFAILAEFKIILNKLMSTSLLILKKVPADLILT